MEIHGEERFEEASFKICKHPDEIKTKYGGVCKLLTPQYYNSIMSKNNPAFIISPIQIQHLRFIAEFFKFPLNHIFSIYLSIDKYTSLINIVPLCLICKKLHNLYLTSSGALECKNMNYFDVSMWLEDHLVISHSSHPLFVNIEIAIKETDVSYSLLEKALMHKIGAFARRKYNRSTDDYDDVFYRKNNSHFCFFCDRFYAIPPAEEIIASHLRKCPAINTTEK